MRLSSLLLVGLTVLVVCCGVVSSSKDVYSETVSSDLVNSVDYTSINRKGGRLLRTTDTANADRYSEFNDDEERVSAYWDDLFSYIIKWTRSKKDNSPPKGRSLAPIQVFSPEKVTPPILTRSKSVTHQKIDHDMAMKIMNDIDKDIKGTYTKTFATMERQRKDPDQMFTFFNLDPKYARTTKANKRGLWTAAEGQMERYGEYVLWYKFSKYYKRKHPNWMSKFADATPA